MNSNSNANAQQQQQERIPFVFQGSVYYKTQINMRNRKTSAGQVLSVYDSPIDGAFIGTILSSRNEDTGLYFDKFTITSFTGHTYIYDANTELLIRFIYTVGMETIPTQQDIERLEEFTRTVDVVNSENDWTGTFHILDLHEPFPQEQEAQHEQVIMK